MRETLTININLDKKCTRCKKGGATDGGLCLKCIGNTIKVRANVRRRLPAPLLRIAF